MIKLQSSDDRHDIYEPLELAVNRDAPEKHVDQLQKEFDELKKIFAAYVEEQESFPLPTLTERKL